MSAPGERRAAPSRPAVPSGGRPPYPSGEGPVTCVVGGGLLGLATAWRLVQAGHRVTVVEAAREWGGLASPWTLATPDGDVEWDRYYHVIAGADTALVGLLGELGLAERVVWKTTRTNFYDGRRLYPLNNAVDYLRLPALGAIDKLRLALTLHRGSRADNNLALEGQSAEAWLTQLGGARNWQQLWRPLLRSKLGSNVEHASAAYIQAVIRRFYGAREGRSKRERFGYVQGGYRVVLDRLVAALRERGATLHAAWPVARVERQADGRFAVSAAGDHEPLQADQVVLTTPAPLSAAIAPQLEAAERERLCALRWQGIVCASLLLTRPLGGAYMSYLTDEGLPFTTVIEMSTLVDRSAFGGLHLAYLPRYVPADDAAFDKSDEALLTEFIAGLTKMFPDLLPEHIVARRIARARHVLAVPTQHYSRGKPPLATSVPGLWIVNASQIVNAALSVNDSVLHATSSVQQMLAETAA